MQPMPPQRPGPWFSALCAAALRLLEAHEDKVKALQDVLDAGEPRLSSPVQLNPEPHRAVEEDMSLTGSMIALQMCRDSGENRFCEPARLLPQPELAPSVAVGEGHDVRCF